MEFHLRGSVIQRVETGIRSMDQLLMGGLPKGYTCVLIGPPGSGKSIFAKKFIHTALRKGEPAILVSTAETLDVVMETMAVFGWAPREGDPFIFVDCVSWRIGGSTSSYQASLIHPADVSVAIQKAVEERGVAKAQAPVLVIDSFTDIVKYGGAARALKLLDSLRIRLHRDGVTSLILVEEGVDEPRVVNAIEYSVAGTIRMKFSEQGRFFMVSRMLATPLTLKWIPFIIGG
jgi:KaiC/GvpD/RAD55 family RecA-like ATPase